MAAEQKSGVGLLCIVVGVCFLLWAASESGRQQERSTQFDRAINRETDRQNRLPPGTTDRQYAPGTTWTHGRGPSPGVDLGWLVGAGLIIGGIVMLVSAASRRGTG
jgi:hypothetical protein